MLTGTKHRQAIMGAENEGAVLSGLSLLEMDHAA
jgi:hypothetical protein